jgi:hypothetical protein
VYPEVDDVEACGARIARRRCKPLVHARVRPPAARWIWPAAFGSTFVAGLDAPDAARRRYPRIVDLRDRMRAWAPVHFVMMLEAHRAFRAAGCTPLEHPVATARTSARPGSVYAFATPSMPGIVKIGATTRDPTERLREANESDTWRPPEPYAIACVAWVEDAFAAERAVHAMLAARRVTSDARRGQREFFRLTVADARAVFELLRAP